MGLVDLDTGDGVSLGGAAVDPLGGRLGVDAFGLLVADPQSLAEAEAHPSGPTCAAVLDGARSQVLPAIDPHPSGQRTAAPRVSV
ncbi:MAG: hypothetical protein LH468_11090 [Nocardioides sp.]|nr:hypothetical protein [Nocardioides sp.]